MLNWNTGINREIPVISLNKLQLRNQFYVINFHNIKLGISQKQSGASTSIVFILHFNAILRGKELCV